MAFKKDNKTKSSRKFTFKSFRDHVDGIKIDPISDLSKRSFHDAEVSHFLSTLEHWREVNLTKNFQDLVEIVEPLSMSLPQLLYHKNDIFKALHNTILLNDSLSLPPTLELLSQFCHDLGSDFMEFYERSLIAIKDIALSQQEPSALESIFNALAYLFKYLSKVLSKDLKLTFKTLLPLLTVQKKDYINRFASQAITFLVKKTKSASFQSFVNDVFDCPEVLEDAISSYHNALSIIFSDCFKSASGVLHSKVSILLPILISKSIQHPRFTAIFNDIIMELLDYTQDSKNAEPLYSIIIETLKNESQNFDSLDQLSNCCQIMYTLSFGETGKRVSNWSEILNMIRFLQSKLDDIKVNDDDDRNQLKMYNFVDSMAIWCATIIRNCDSNDLAKFHIKIFNCMSQIDNGSGFLGFIDNATELSKSRTLQFAKKFVLSFISKNWKENHREIALFLQRMNEKGLLSNSDEPDTFQIIIPNDFKLFIFDSFVQTKSITSKEALMTNYWRIATLLNTSLSFDPQIIINFITMLSNSNELTDGLFPQDLIGLSIGAIAKQSLTDDQYSDVLRLIISNFRLLIKSSTFLDNLHLFISSLPKSCKNSISYLKESFDNLLLDLSLILKTQSHEIRLCALNVIIEIFNKASDEIPDSVLQLRTIEQIPLHIQNARDVPLRFRQLSQNFDAQTPLINNIVVNFMFGQITNKFSPTWEGVTEFFSSNINKVMDLAWKLSFEFISFSYNSFEEPAYFQYDFDMLNLTSDLLEWYPQDARVLTNLQANEEKLQLYQNVDQSLVELAELKRSSLRPTDFARYQVIKLFSKVPQLPESNFASLLPFIINEDLEDTSDVEKGSILEGWTMADRNGLIESLSVFKKLNKVQGIEKVKKVLMTLLMNRQTSTQHLALKCILNLKNQTYIKYTKVLNNLLDDSLFRDEIILLMQNKDKSPIEKDDEPIIIPIILRILFGRAQTLKTNSAKLGRKHAAIKSINNFEKQDIKEFLKLSYWKFDLNNFSKNMVVDPTHATRRVLKNISGFISLNLDLSQTLGKKHADASELLLLPLIYGLSISEYVIDNADQFDPIFEKTARNNRKSGTKLLNQLSIYFGDKFDWSPYGDAIYNNLMKSKMKNFAEENTEDPSSLMKFMSLFVQPNLHFFLYYENFTPLKALLNLLKNPNSKDPVLLLALKFVIDFLEISSNEEIFIDATSVLVSECLNSLVDIFDVTSNHEVNALVVQILLTFVNNDYITNNDIRGVLIESLTSALEKSNAQIRLEVKADIVKIMALLLEEYECSFEEIVPVYKNISKMYKDYSQREMRIEISRVFESISTKFEEFEKISHLIIGLNSYDDKRIREPDYETRLDCFSIINETEYLNLSILEWLPILYCVLFFINDEEDQSMRSSASYTLIRFVDALSSKMEDETIVKFVELFKNLVIPSLKSGMRKKHEGVRVEYVKVIGHIVANISHYDDFDDLKILLNYNEEEEESNFFENIIHLQTFKRQEAIRKLIELTPQLRSNNIAHFILPLVEHYAFWEVEKERIVSQDAIPAVKKLTQYVTWNQYRAIFIRYLGILNNANAKELANRLRDSVSLVVASAAAMRQWNIEPESKPSDLPKVEKLDVLLITDIIPKLHKILSGRDESTVLIRVPLSEALISLVMSCSEDKISSELPGLLTRICQMLRSRAEDLRNAVRKHLGRIAVSLGPRYLKFIIKELKGSLLKGPQIHILSYTLHYLITTMSSHLTHGSLGESVDMIMDSIMSDIFGQASEEKNVDGYSNRTKEIKQNKSFDTGELIAANIYLKDFSLLLTPVKYLLRERLSHKTQTRLNELMRRFAQGLQNNVESSSTDILILVNEIYQQSITIVETEENKRKAKVVDEKVQHFLVQLNAKSQRTQMEYSTYIKTLQQFAFELLRVSVTKHNNLYQPQYLTHFVPYLVDNLKSEDEGVISTALKVLILFAKLDFGEQVNHKFYEAAEQVLTILQDIPSTDSELCQTCLKFLTAVNRYKPDIELKDSAFSYILKKIEPDLDTPQRQSTAFGFLKGLIYKKLMIPEIYDCMDTVSKIMVTSVTNEIRQSARSVYFMFLMEYDQSKGRLEKQFKLLISNLKYPAEGGRLSVLELILMIVNKASKELLDKLSTSFFIALANVSITDLVPTCRESANEILFVMLTKLNENGANLAFIEKYTKAWINQNKKTLLTRCGLNVYENYIKTIGYGESQQLDDIVFEKVQTVMKMASRKDDDVDWQMIYSCMVVFESIIELCDNPYDKSFQTIWDGVVAMMLYPHSWIRLSSSRLVSKLLKEYIDNEEEGNVSLKIDDEYLQNIAYRTFRQLGAPDISEVMAFQSTANLVFVSRKWNKESTPFVYQKRKIDADDEINPDDEAVEGEEEEEEDNKVQYQSAFDWALNRCSAILKNDSKGAKHMLVTKKAIISYCEFLTTFLSDDKLRSVLSERLLVPLLYISEQEILEDDSEANPLPDIARNSLDKISKKIGVSEYNILLSSAMKEIQARREERKAKRSQLAFTNPELHAQKKIAKHMKDRQKRRSNRNENGHYKPKRRKMH